MFLHRTKRLGSEEYFVCAKNLFVFDLPLINSLSLRVDVKQFDFDPAPQRTC